MTFTENDLITYASGTIAAIGGAVFGLQKAMKMWSTDKKDIYKDTVETDLFHRLNEETKRLHEQNIKLAATIENLRVELSKLYEEITTLRIENATLRQEVSALNTIIGQLKEGVDHSNSFQSSRFLED
jgi:shikimate kinase